MVGLLIISNSTKGQLSYSYTWNGVCRFEVWKSWKGRWPEAASLLNMPMEIWFWSGVIFIDIETRVSIYQNSSRRCAVIAPMVEYISRQSHCLLLVSCI
jgi:hypothetical protein